ncbi:DUF4350 domain-containing protein [Allostreptomyces psammosilenae]|uniref:DUF4350 domain-containing protein n=1 Tax=Allostreptomyces psammosilenae TaxID=1892865 RepID=A0A852ZV97_9ACTN|nr:DUF4350 domain-containing protein [Allostreptomyces psammosilenae]NYI06169.1 hypothetical protein [Allostreptomyces psammosilenae]
MTTPAPTVTGATGPTAPAPTPSTTAPSGNGDGRRARTSTDPSGTDLWRRFRVPLLLVAGIVLVAVGGALLQDSDRAPLDPRSPAPEGTMALAELLRDRGVTVEVAESAIDAADALRPGSTLVVADPFLVFPEQAELLRQAGAGTTGRLVLLEPDDYSLPVFTDEISAGFDYHDTQDLQPECELTAARSAGALSAGGYGYTTTADGADACYPLGGADASWLLRVPTDADSAPGLPQASAETAGDGTVLAAAPTPPRAPGDAPEGDLVVLGSSAPLTNDALDEAGNAALALNVLGGGDRVVWYMPQLSELTEYTGGQGQEGFFSLLPAGWRWGLVQLGVAVLLLALWRARRLGPVVTEQLPAVVRAAEATEGRARLYERAHAGDRAADALRRSARHRLAPMLRIGGTQADDPTVVVPAVSGRTTGRHPGQVHDLLFGPPPTDPKALVRLADELDALVREVRSS